MRTRIGLRIGLAVVVGALSTVVTGVGTASAHVTVNPREATQGGYGKFAFRVPNEKANASTTKLEVVIPTDDAAIASVSTRPVPGWTVAVERTTLSTPLKVHDSEVAEVISKITWTATDGSAVIPGQFQEFEVSAGPLPAVDRIVFKALQTYSDGEVVRWIEEPTGGAEPDHPAPVLTLSKAAAATANAPVTNAGGGGGGAGGGGDGGGDGWPLALGMAGLVAGLAALVLSSVALRRRPA